MTKTSSQNEKATAPTATHPTAAKRRFTVSRLALGGRPLVTISAKAS